MIELVVCLAVGLGLVVSLALYLALSRRRVARLLATEQAKSSARELAAKVALQERLATDVAVIVAPLRALLEEQARARAASAADVAQQVTSFRALVEWFAAFTSAQYEQARSLTEASQETRKADRGPRTAPSIAPPGSAEVLPSGPAQIAAGLGPRPASRSLPASATPHAPPVRVGAPRRATLLGIQTPAPPAPPTQQEDSGDSGAWLHGDRPSDTEGERTRVGARPSPETLGLSRRHGSAPTLPSMQAITTSDGTRGGQ